MKSFTASLALLAAIVPSVYGHGVIIDITGANGVSTAGFGVRESEKFSLNCVLHSNYSIVADTPRNGTNEQPFQIDTPVLKDLTTGKALFSYLPSLQAN